jgi:3-oxoacyl-[acyl-carrier-protein] synthase III
MKARIAGVGAYLPSRIMTNHDLEKLVETTDSWIVERTGIRERRIAADDESTADLAAGAGRRAIEAAGISEKDIDLILVATTTPDMFFPSTACLVQARLDCSRAAAFDLSAACSGFLFALSVGSEYIETGRYRNVLVIGAEVMSRIVNWSDRNTCILFGDGAGAVVLQPGTGKSGVLSTHLHSDGQYWDLIRVTEKGRNLSQVGEKLHQFAQFVEMKGSETFKIAVRTLEEAAREALEQNHLDAAALDWVIPHQANIRIINAVSERLGVPSSKVVLNLEHYGNTSAASVPIAIDEAVSTGKLREGHLVLLLAFGAGLTWSSALVRW